MIEPSVELQEAVYAALANSVSAPCFEVVPNKQPFPFVKYGDDHIMTIGAYADIPWWDAEVTVHIFSQSRSLREVKTLMGQVVVALNQRLNLPSFHIYEWKHVDTIQMTDKDGITHHGIVKLCYYIQSPAS